MIEDVLSIQMPVKEIAQHYGMYTDCLDLSGSFAVALFFATCRWDCRKGRYRPLNHREIKEHPLGVIYVTMPMVHSNNPDSFMPIGYSVLKRPSLQHGYLMVDDGSLSQDDFWFIPIEQNVRLSNEMYRFFAKWEYLLPSRDQQRIEQLAREMNESDSVNRGLFLEACRRRGMTEDNDELISKYQGYRMMDEPRTIPIEDKVLIDREIRENDFIWETGMGFTCRLSNTGRSHPMTSIRRSDQTSP